MVNPVIIGNPPPLTATSSGDLTITGHNIKSSTSYMSLATTTQEVVRILDTSGAGASQRFEFDYNIGSNSMRLTAAGVANLELNASGGGAVVIPTTLSVSGDLTTTGHIVKANTTYMSLTTANQEVFRLNDFGSGVTKRLDLSYTSGNNSINMDTINTNFHILSDPSGSTIISYAFQALTSIQFAGLRTSTSYANDSAAATGGVALGQLYRNGSAVMIRVA